jgi:hypothetical protein
MHVAFIVKNLKEAPGGLRCKATIIDKMTRMSSIGTSVDLVVVFRTVSHSMQRAAELACSKATVPIITSTTSMWDVVDRARSVGIELACWQKDGFWGYSVGSALLDEVEEIYKEIIEARNRNLYTSDQKTSRLMRLFAKLGGDKRQLRLRWTSVVSSFNNNRPGTLPLVNESIAAGRNVYSRASSSLKSPPPPGRPGREVEIPDVRSVTPAAEPERATASPSSKTSSVGFPALNNRIAFLVETMREFGVTEVTVMDDGSVLMKWTEVVMVPTPVAREEVYEVSTPGTSP